MRRIPGTVPLFKLFGITVFLHWTWFLVLLVLPSLHSNRGYGDNWMGYLWVGLELVALFGIVTMHEFGHALACRSVKGRADTIFLLPIGGVAMVQPPMRPLPMLWSLVAGPLVNVLLLPILAGLYWWLSTVDGVPEPAMRSLWMINILNVALLVFNMLPIYPLDGGQIMQTLLWPLIGRATSLIVSASIGIAFSVAVAAFAAYALEPILVLIALFLIWQSWQAIRYARFLAAHPEEAAAAEERMLRGEPAFGDSRMSPDDARPMVEYEPPRPVPPEDAARLETGEQGDPRAVGPAGLQQERIMNEPPLREISADEDDESPRALTADEGQRRRTDDADEGSDGVTPDEQDNDEDYGGRTRWETNWAPDRGRDPYDDRRRPDGP